MSDQLQQRIGFVNLNSMRKNLPLVIFLLLLAFFYLFALNLSVFAVPTSLNYELMDYGFGGGGTGNSTSSHYSVLGIAGEVSGKSATSNYSADSGLVYLLQSNVPPAPALTNPGSNYDRLKFVINIGNNPGDAKFAVAISDDNFVTTRYVQNDGTVGISLGLDDWLTYAGWGGTSGTYITGLTQNTTYKIKVAAKQGNFTQTDFGPLAVQTTSIPSLTFGISSDTLTFSNLNSGNNYTDSTKSTLLTTSTNAYNGYIIYGHDTQPLTHTADATKTIADYGSPNSAPTNWTGIGFGYTTNDNNLTGGTADRFTSGGPKYAGFNNSVPGDPAADHPGPVLSPINSEQFTVSYRVTGDQTASAGTYKTNVEYIVVPTY